jgi:hypothetical protein
MEIQNENHSLGLVSRAVAFGLALATTTAITTTLAAIFSAPGQNAGGQFVRIAAAPLRALLGV